MEMTPEQIVENEKKSIISKNKRDFALHAIGLGLTWSIPAIVLLKASPSLMAFGAAFGAIYAGVNKINRVEPEKDNDAERAQLCSDSLGWKNKEDKTITDLLEKEQFDLSKIYFPSGYEQMKLIQGVSRKGYVAIAEDNNSFLDGSKGKIKNMRLFKIAHQIATRRLEYPKIQERMKAINDFAMGFLGATGITYFATSDAGIDAYVGMVMIIYFMNQVQTDIIDALPKHIAKRADKLASLYIGSALPGLETLSPSTYGKGDLPPKWLQCIEANEKSVLDKEYSTPRCGDPSSSCYKPCFQKNTYDGENGDAVRGYELIKMHRKMFQDGVWRGMTRLKLLKKSND